MATATEKDFKYYFLKLYHLNAYLEERAAKGETLKKGLQIGINKNVSELDLRMNTHLKGMRKASLTSKERAKLKTMQQEIYKKFG